MKRAILACAWAACAMLATAAQAVCLDAHNLTGVNMAGAEFNSKRIPGVLNKDYVYPTRSDLAYFRSRGATTIRLPVLWERLQPALMGELNSTEVNALAATVAAAAGERLCVIIDVHNYAAYRGEVIGSASVPEEAFFDLWTRIARRFPDPSQVALGLMNEPHKVSVATWAGIAQRTVTNLRSKGVEHLILVPGGRWSGVHEWSKTYSGASNSTALATLRDPKDRMLIEVHQYADEYFSGTQWTCHPPERFPNMFRIISEWARTNGHKLILAEFGTSADPNCLASLDQILSLVSDRSVWRGFTYWAAGRWWGTYPMSIQPTASGDAPQMGVVGKYLGR